MAKKKNKDLHGEIVKHLQGDIKLYGSEANEDRKLIKRVMKGSKSKQGMEDRYRESSGAKRAAHGYKKTSNPKRSFDRFVEKEESAAHERAEKKKRK